MLKGVFVQNRANLSIRLNVKLDQTAEDLVRLSYKYLQGRRFLFLWAPVPMTDLSLLWKTFSWYLPAICRSCYLCPLLHSVLFIVCLWRKCLFPSSWYPPITQLKTAINYTHTHSSSLPFFKLNKPICEPLLVPCVHQPSDDLDALLLGFVQYVSVCLVLGSPNPRHSTPSVVSQVLNWQELITDFMLGTFSLGEKGIFLKTAWIAFSEWIQEMKGLYLKL